MKLTRISAGLVDSGFASLATFAIGLYAVAIWGDEPADLGVYALFIAAFTVAAVIPTQVAFVPAEKATLQVEPIHRTRLFGRILRPGVPLSVVSALIVAIAALVATLQGAIGELVVPLLITSFITSILSPIQDHARRLLHFAGHSWAAALVSLAQFSGAMVGLLVLPMVFENLAWVPFGALSVANLLSLIVAASLVGANAKRRTGYVEGLDRAMDDLRMRRLFRSGRWLVGTGALSTGNNLLVATIISTVAGQEALGFAEGARIVAQPMLVLTAGLQAVLGPQSMAAAAERNRVRAHQISRVFTLLTVGLGAAYALLIGVNWFLNPFGAWVPQAYAIGGLVVFTIVANGLNGLAAPGRMELIGANQEEGLLRAEVKNNAVQLVIATGMSFLGLVSLTAGAYARAAGFLGLGASRLVTFTAALDRHYGSANAKMTSHD